MPDVLSLHTLVVEDDPDDQTILVANLRRGIDQFGFVVGALDFRLSMAGSVREALDRLNESAVDLLLVDLNLPDSTGMSTIDALREVARKTPMVVVSGSGDVATAISASLAGADDFLPKEELTPERLVRTILTSLLRKRLG